jgi:hypothetical protein
MLQRLCVSKIAHLFAEAPVRRHMLSKSIGQIDLSKTEHTEIVDVAVIETRIFTLLLEVSENTS